MTFSVFALFFLAGMSMSLSVSMMKSKRPLYGYGYGAFVFFFVALLTTCAGTVANIGSATKSQMSYAHLLAEPLLVAFGGSVAFLLVPKALNMLSRGKA